MDVWRISFAGKYDLEPVLTSRALGRFMDSFAHTFTFINTQHNTTPLPGLGKLERCCASTTRCLVVDETVSIAWTGLCYDSTLYYKYVHYLIVGGSRQRWPGLHRTAVG
jgi:hypothetical protein